MKIIIGEWAGGATVRLELSKYALISGTTKNAPRFYQITLDSNGAISSGYEIWANDELMPEGTTYKLTVFNSSGLITIGPDQVWICGTAPINLNAPAGGPPIVTPPPNQIVITPGFVTLQPGQQQQFTANMQVTWTSSDGNITSAGLYTAPNVTTSTTVTITATSVTDPTNKSQIAISVQSVTGITVSVSPGTATMLPNETQQFTATVSGTANTQVVWSASLGTITPTGSGNTALYTAPSVTTATTATVTATSAANTTISGSANVSIQIPAAVTVTVAPASASLTPGQTQQFSHTVNGSVNQAVTWSVATASAPELPAGNGTITSGGLYTAPATIIGATTTAIQATSVADPTAHGNATIILSEAVGTQPIDVLSWMTLSTRSTQHLVGDPSAPYAVQVLDTDPGYPTNFPTGVIWFVKNKLGHPWDIWPYTSTQIGHWITENGDSADQAACQAANGTSCWMYERAYKRHIAQPAWTWPRYLTPGVPVTVNSPGPNTVYRTTNCESTYTVVTIGDVQGITSGPFKISWGGSIDKGTGTLATAPNYDSVNGVDTIKNEYFYSGSINGATFKDREEYYLVKGFGRVAWYSYHRTDASSPWVYKQKTVNTTLASGGAPALVFPCGVGKPWF